MKEAEFIKYITNPLTKEEMQLLYKANNINYEKCSLYYDFIITLNLLVINTFLGKDVINNDKDIENHFLWCINKIFDNFKEEGIIFERTNELKEYFYNFYIELFYKYNQDNQSVDRLNNLALLSFEYKRLKTKSDMDVLLELYRLFEKSLNFKLKT